MSLRNGLLGLLTYEDMTGYDLHKVFMTSINHFWPAHRSQVYRELGKMENEQLISSKRKVQSDKPNKRIYHLEDKGRKALQEWLSLDVGEDDIQTKSSFLLKLFFHSQVSEDATIRALEQYIECCSAKLNHLKESIEVFQAQPKTDYVPHEFIYWQMTSMYGMQHLSKNIQWAESCIELLRQNGLNH